jgi:transmembrane sensor
MNTPDPIEIDSLLDERAAEWLFEREEGFAPGRAEAFAKWRVQDSRHAEAVVRVERTLALLDELPEVRAPLEARVAGLKRQATMEPDSHGKHRNFPRLAWAVGLAAAVALGFATWQASAPRAPAGEHYATDSAAQRSMLLPDGSLLDLNTGTDVVVQFTAKERRILLSQGEAHFKVAHDTLRPFTVTAGGVSVRAVGTAFNVRLAGKGVDVFVVEGKVELGQSEAPATRPFGESASMLMAGERVQLANFNQAAGPRIERVDAQGIHALLNWQNPLTSFAGVPLRDVVDRFNRRNATQLILADADLGDRRIGGLIALDQVDAFVRLLEQDGDIVADRTDAAGIALRRAR